MKKTVSILTRTSDQVEVRNYWSSPEEYLTVRIKTHKSALIMTPRKSGRPSFLRWEQFQYHFHAFISHYARTTGDETISPSSWRITWSVTYQRTWIGEMCYEHETSRAHFVYNKQIVNPEANFPSHLNQSYAGNCEYHNLCDAFPECSNTRVISTCSHLAMGI